MAQLERYIRPYWGYIILTTLIKLLGTVTELMIPSLMEVILDDKVPAGDRTAIFLYGGLMLLCAVVCLTANIVANRMSAQSSGRITQALRHDLFQKLQSLSAQQMDHLTVPSAESRLTSDTYNINQFLARIQRIGIRAPMLLIGGTVMMLIMDMGLALVLIVKSLLKAPLEALFAGHMAARAVRYFLTVVAAGVLWPMTFRWFGKLGSKR